LPGISAGRARYKLPKAAHFIGLDEFPRSTTGKVKRQELEARLGKPCKSEAAP
jgi:acyl-CoA synthetase (AMP-forming)/AMP-acid ligase II